MYGSDPIAKATVQPLPFLFLPVAAQIRVESSLCEGSLSSNAFCAAEDLSSIALKRLIPPSFSGDVSMMSEVTASDIPAEIPNNRKNITDRNMFFIRASFQGLMPFDRIL